MKRRAVLHKLTPEITCIDDAGDSVCYVVCGKDQAAVIDTVNGRENLYDIVREITDLPLIVVDTHGHGDHTGGNCFFKEAYMHPADVAIDKEFVARRKELDIDLDHPEKYGATREELEAFLDPYAHCEIKPLREGEKIDLGGKVLEVVLIAGHTPGSIALLDRQTGFLFSGDAINGQAWLQLDHSLKLQQYLDSLNALDPLRPYIKELHNGHDVEGVPAAYIDEMKDAIRTIIETHGAGDEDYTWFGGTCKRHWMRENTWVLYTPDKL